MTYMDLDIETKEYISELTDKIREKYNIKTPIQDMTEIVKQIGGDVIQKYNFDSSESSNLSIPIYTGVSEKVDETDLKSVGFLAVWVQIPFPVFML